MFDFDRFVRRTRRRFRSRYYFARGVFVAILHIHHWVEYQKAMMEEQERRADELFKKNDNGVYVAVGTALTSWATMEQAIVFIAAHLLRTEPEKAGLVLYSIINFSVWISLIDELFAVDTIFAPLKPKWNKLADRLRQLKDDRDTIAHHAAHKPDLNASAFEETSLRPSELDIRRKSLKREPMTDDDIFAFGSKVHALSSDLIKLAHLMSDRRQASLEKLAPQETDQHLVDAQ